MTAMFLYLPVCRFALMIFMCHDEYKTALKGVESGDFRHLNADSLHSNADSCHLKTDSRRFDADSQGNTVPATMWSFAQVLADRRWRKMAYEEVDMSFLLYPAPYYHIWTYNPRFSSPAMEVDASFKGPREDGSVDFEQIPFLTACLRWVGSAATCLQPPLLGCTVRGRGCLAADCGLLCVAERLSDCGLFRWRGVS